MLVDSSNTVGTAHQFNLYGERCSGSLLGRDMGRRSLQPRLLDPRKHAPNEPQIEFIKDAIGPFLLNQQTSVISSLLTTEKAIDEPDLPIREWAL